MQASIDRFEPEFQLLKFIVQNRGSQKKTEMLPKNKHLRCKCGGELFTYFKQTRSSDEPVSQYYQCTQCNFQKRIDG